MICKGVGGSIEALEDRLIIRRTALLGTFLHGLKGEKTIPYSAITSVQYKRPGLLNGYIQFSLGGGVESRKGIIDATKDENTLFFSDDASFQSARKHIESRMGVRMQTAPAPSAESVADSLEKLAALRDRGILTAEEFDEQKGKLLGKCPLVIATSVIPEVPLTAEDAEELPTEARSRMMAAMDRAIQTAAIAPKEPVRTFGKRNGV